MLICNGKNQNEVQDDLEAFLGDRSEEFVSWYYDSVSIASLVKNQ